MLKISPVGSNPAISNPSPTGLSADKLERVKAILSGEEPGEIKKETNPNAIKLKTNHTIEREIAPPAPEVPGEGAPNEANSPNSAISDAGKDVNAANAETKPLDPQIAAIQKARRAFQQERQAFERDKQEFLAKSGRAELEQKLRTNALSTLQELGVTYDQLTQEILASQGQAPSPEIQALKDEIKALKQGVDQTLASKEAENEKAVLAQMRRNVEKLSYSGDDFELIRESKSFDDVVDLIHRTYKETGEVMTEDEAMKLVEAELLEDLKRIAKTKKAKGITPEDQGQIPTQDKPPAQAGMKTLTNKDQARASLDRKQRAMLAFQGQLRK